MYDANHYFQEKAGLSDLLSMNHATFSYAFGMWSRNFLTYQFVLLVTWPAGNHPMVHRGSVRMILNPPKDLKRAAEAAHPHRTTDKVIGFGNLTINLSTQIALQLRIELFLAGGFQFSDLLCQASTKDSEKSSWTYAITKHKSMEHDA